jgi:hypothetical protein
MFINNVTPPEQVNLENIVTYFNSGLYMNLFGAMELVDLATQVNILLNNPSHGHFDAIATRSIAAGLAFGSGAAKYHNYKKVKSLLEQHGWHDRIAYPMITLCDEHTAKLAAKHAGYGKEYRDFAKRENRTWLRCLYYSANVLAAIPKKN